MNIQETIQALGNILLRGEARPTGHADYVRIFALDAHNVTQGRLTIYRGVYSHAKWYVSAIDSGPVLDDERIPCAWRLWTERQEPLTLERWHDVVAAAQRLAHEERAAKQALRDAMPERKRKRLEYNVRKYIYQQLFYTHHREGSL